VRILKQYLFSNFSNPYPTEDQKVSRAALETIVHRAVQKKLARQAGIKTSSVNYWFINARVRIWRPLGEPKHHCAEKGSRSLACFW
jgi:hypothetical protein